MGALDDNTILDGLLSIGLRLYESECECEIEPGSPAEAERAVFAVLFGPNWRALTDEGRALARTFFDVDDQDRFDRTLADVERREAPDVFGMTFAEAQARVGDA